MRLFSNSSKHLATKSINRFLEDRSFESFDNGVQSAAGHFWIDPKISHIVTKKSPSTKTLKRQHLVIWLVPVCWNLFLGGSPTEAQKNCATQKTVKHSTSMNCPYWSRGVPAGVSGHFIAPLPCKTDKRQHSISSFNAPVPRDLFLLWYCYNVDRAITLI